jgi:hypothetical protein
MENLRPNPLMGGTRYRSDGNSRAKIKKQHCW